MRRNRSPSPKSKLGTTLVVTGTGLPSDNLYGTSRGRKRSLPTRTPVRSLQSGEGNTGETAAVASAGFLVTTQASAKLDRCLVSEDFFFFNLTP